MIDHEEIYKNEAERYDLLVSREDFQGRILPALRTIRRLEGCDVAELGAGTGRLTVLIAPLVNSIQAFDNSEPMLEFAARRLETLGTGWEDPRAPTRELQAYYAYLEEGQGFERTWIRTNYRFASPEEAEQTIEFFFGTPLSRRVREEKLTVVPECTGIWWRKL